MQTSHNQPDNGNVLSMGGWIIAAIAGVVMFGVLYYRLGYYLISSIGFGAAIGLIVLWVLLIAVSRSEPIVAPSRVRKIVPRSEQGMPGQTLQATPPAAGPNGITPLFADTPPASAVATPTRMVRPVEAAPAIAAAPVKVVAPAAVAKPATEPKAVARPADAPAGPIRLKAPRAGGADNLKEIEGIGPALEKLMNGLGIYHFDQIAAWSDADVAVLDGEMKGFKGRIARDKWVVQAGIIVSEGLEAFRKRAKSNGY